MDTSLLWITIIIYIVMIATGFFFKIKWILMFAGLLWFIPIFEVNNMFITIVSSIMILFHGILGFYESKESDY